LRKQLIGQEVTKATRETQDTWLDLEKLASVEITSENPAFPIENALTASATAAAGWQASAPGPQTLRIHFDRPQKIRRIHLRFVESEHERGQEFLLSYVGEGKPKREIVRQQWTFSPGGASEEVEDYTVDLENVASIELTIDADRGRNRIPATLAELLIA
jgi:hypothetical protein